MKFYDGSCKILIQRHDLVSLLSWVAIIPKKKHIAWHILLPDFFLEHLGVKPLTIPLCLLKLPLFHSHPDLREQSQHGVQILGSLLWRFYPVVVCFCFSLYGHFKILSFFLSWVFLVNILRSRTALLQALLNRSYCELEVLS